ncbi:MAG: DUF445 family protein [Mogibacterium sp.]|nr:DUF445 family protein [Mogibacterium sp.]
MLHYLAGPLIGMIIGYCTNYLAVKMLFRPRTEKYLFGRRLPMTPGAIPRGKTRLAKAAGEVVATYLVTEEEIGERLLAEETETAVVGKVMKTLRLDIGDDLLRVAGSEEEADHIVQKLNDLLTSRIVEALQRMDLESKIRTEGKQIVTARLAGSMIGLLLNERAIDSLLESVGKEVTQLIDTRGEELLRPHIERKVAEVRTYTAIELLQKADLSEERIRLVVTAAYREAVQAGVTKMLRKIDIAGIIEAKINALSPEELERLVLSVMKKELDVIVNLGALIGLILGSLNIFLQ